MLALWKKSYEQPRQHTKKQRHYFADKGWYSQSYGFSSSHVWMWVLDHKESFMPKNWYFELWCWRRLLRVPWTARRSNQSILKEICPEYSFKGLMLKLQLQYFGHLMQQLTHWKRPWYWEREGRKRRGQQRARWLDGIIDSMDIVWAHSGRQWRSGEPGLLQSMWSQRVRHDWVTEQQEEGINWSRYLRQSQKYLTYCLAVRLRRYGQKDFCSANCVTNICFYYFYKEC